MEKYNYDHIAEIIHEQTKQIKVKQENIIIDQLRKIGHKFETGQALEKFVKERLTIVEDDYSHEWTVWLDHGDQDKCYILAIFYKNPKMNILEGKQFTMSVDLGRFLL